jgi:hypothetical protein
MSGNSGPAGGINAERPIAAPNCCRMLTLLTSICGVAKVPRSSIGELSVLDRDQRDVIGALSFRGRSNSGLLHRVPTAGRLLAHYARQHADARGSSSPVTLATP